MNKTVLYSTLGLVLAVVAFMFSQSQNKQLVSTINKVYYAYSSYIIDMGRSPSNIKDLYQNQTNQDRWKGPYVSKSTLDDYTNGDIQIIQASNIPTKNCSIDYISNCYTWIKVNNFNGSSFEELKSSINENADPFFANNSVYFKLSIVE